MTSGSMPWLWWLPAVDVHVYILDLMNVSCLWRIEVCNDRCAGQSMFLVTIELVVRRIGIVMN